MVATKSVENIQFLPFLTTDAKYWGGEVVVVGGGGCFMAVGEGRSP